MRKLLIDFYSTAMTFLIVFVVGFASANAYAASNYEEAIAFQQITVTGTVVDEEGLPMPGVNIIVKGTTLGTFTDADGKYTLSVPNTDAVLEFTFIGYAAQEVKLGSRTVIDIAMKPEATALQEVQVIAYGSTKKVTVTGALSSIKSDDLLKTPVGNVSNALVGKLPGLSSVQLSGQPGNDAANIYVRGVGSLTTGKSFPLCLVDGVERGFNQIDPNEIDDITILKDASATAVFGVRGANGVILITTKRGKKGKAKLSFSTNAALQLPTRIPEFANSYDYVTSYNNAQIHDGVDPSMVVFTPEMVEAFKNHSNPLIYSDTDWIEMLIKNSAWQTQHNFNISGGSERIKYFASLGIYTQEGLFRTFDTHDYNTGFKYNRYNYRINMDVDVTKTMSMNINLGGHLTNKREPNYNNGTYTNIRYLFSNIYATPPIAGAGIVDGKWVTINSKTFGKFGGVSDALNSYYGKGYNTSENNVINFDFMLQQKLDFLTKGLKIHLKGAYNSGVTITKRRESRANRYEAFIGENGENLLKKTQEETPLGYSEGLGQARDWYIEGAINYNNNFGDHHVSTLLMYNQSMKYYYSSSFLGIPRSYVGFVGRVTYDYKTKYLADFSIGYNGSENFAKNKRFGTFPAGSLGWIISEENFMKPLKHYLDYVKLRVSYGIVGSDNFGDRFLYLPNSYILSTGSYGFGSSNNFVVNGAKESRIGNPDVTWETATKQNYGIDMHFFNNHLKTSFDYFIEHRKDILITRNMNPTYIAVVLPVYNLGKVNNKGYEISVTWTSKIRNVKYHVGTNLSYAKNKIIFKDEIPQPYTWMCETGRPVSQQFGYLYDGFFSEEDAANYLSLKGQENGIPDHGSGFSPLAGDVKYKDLNGDHKIDNNDICAIGYPHYPLLTGNVSTGFSWKGFDFNMIWSGAFKTSRYIKGLYRESFGASKNSSLLSYMIKDAWTPAKGNSSKAPAISLTNSANNNYKDSDLWLRDASYIRLKNVEIGYSLPKSILKNSGVNNIRLSLSGYNLLTFDKIKFCDPESNPSGDAYPLIKIINWGLKLDF